MHGAARRPIADAYWLRSNADERMGPAAETFAEFDLRVGQFIVDLDHLPSETLIFGHAQFLALAIWRLRTGSQALATSMKEFRAFQLNLPMANCAVYTFRRSALGGWVAAAAC